jgi:hypothetical protein
MKFKRKRNKGEEKFLVWVVMVVEVLWRGGRVYTFFSINGIDSQTWTMNQSFTIAARPNRKKAKTKQNKQLSVYCLSICYIYMHAYVIMDHVRCCVCCESVGCWARDPAAKTRSWPNRKGGGEEEDRTSRHCLEIC